MSMLALLSRRTLITLQCPHFTARFNGVARELFFGATCEEKVSNSNPERKGKKRYWRSMSKEEFNNCCKSTFSSDMNGKVLVHLFPFVQFILSSILQQN